MAQKYKTVAQNHNALKRQDKIYKAKKMTAFTFRYHNVHDADVINRLKEVSNKNDYIRKLILQDIKK